MFLHPLDNNQPVFTLTGANFDSSFDLFCQFRRKLNFVNHTEATFIDSEHVSCALPANATEYARGEGIVQVQLGFNPKIDGLDNQTAIGQASVMFYSPPKIAQISPKLGSTAGGTKVLISGNGFQLDLGGVWCKFGT